MPAEIASQLGLPAGSTYAEGLAEWRRMFSGEMKTWPAYRVECDCTFEMTGLTYDQANSVLREHAEGGSAHASVRIIDPNGSVM